MHGFDSFAQTVCYQQITRLHTHLYQRILAHIGTKYPQSFANNEKLVVLLVSNSVDSVDRLLEVWYSLESWTETTERDGSQFQIPLMHLRVLALDDYRAHNYQSVETMID